jgi:hypothetical protein
MNQRVYVFNYIHTTFHVMYLRKQIRKMLIVTPNLKIRVTAKKHFKQFFFYKSILEYAISLIIYYKKSSRNDLFLFYWNLTSA